MIYTLGKKAAYDFHFAAAKRHGVQLHKKGRTENYFGGSVWRTREEVEAYIAENQPRLAGYVAYGVEADWHDDTAQHLISFVEPFHDLLRDAPMVELEAA